MMRIAPKVSAPRLAVKKRGQRVHFKTHILAAMGGALAATLFLASWVAVSLMGTATDVHVQLLTLVEMTSISALIQGAAVSFAVGSLVGGATAWVCNRLGLLVEPE